MCIPKYANIIPYDCFPSQTPSKSLCGEEIAPDMDQQVACKNLWVFADFHYSVIRKDTTV